ncbi:helix-turn-helix domain-containing protein [Saccharopolyspora sp. NPDC003752]
MEPTSKAGRSTALARALVELQRQAKESRARVGLRSSRSALAKESGVSEQTLSDWFNSRHAPRDLEQLMTSSKC